jgi:hypothetical protein
LKMVVRVKGHLSISNRSNESNKQCQSNGILIILGGSQISSFSVL